MPCPPAAFVCSSAFKMFKINKKTPHRIHTPFISHFYVAIFIYIMLLFINDFIILSYLYFLMTAYIHYLFFLKCLHTFLKQTNLFRGFFCLYLLYCSPVAVSDHRIQTLNLLHGFALVAGHTPHGYVRAKFCTHTQE